jgi:hypothetical protein
MLKFRVGPGPLGPPAEHAPERPRAPRRVKVTHESEQQFSHPCCVNDGFLIISDANSANVNAYA